ncbi:MAG: penicillin-binding protein 1C [Anaerolineae bacterium]|nr:penicillin-binding protein 1C [Anaerolineae bacterium]
MRWLWSRLRQLKRWQQIVLGAALLSVGALIIFVLWVVWDLPSIDNIQAGMALPTTHLYDRKGRLLYEVIDPQGGRHEPIPLAEIPSFMREATIATEDRNFYATRGIDLEGMIRALWINLQGGEIRAGGSTITQQVVRNLLLDPDQRAERTLRRKLREMALAVQLSLRYSHDDILALYLNQTYYGNLAYGIQAAARVYFNKDARDLTLAEASMLAGLPQSPAVHDPLTNPEAAKKRQRVVLDLMVGAGYLRPEEADMAFVQPLQYGSGIFPINAPHFVQEAWKIIARDFWDHLYEGGLEVTTTLDLDWQRAAEETVRRQLLMLNTATANKPANNATSAAVVAIDPKTGQILTMVGSGDYFNDETSGAVNMAVAPRQPGSTLKPFTYALTFDPIQENPWTAATMILDVSTPFVTHKLESYTPSNYGLVERGPVLIREALASSYNIPAVVALDKVGVQALVNLLHRLGISTLNDPERLGLSITLGGGEIRLTELTAAYAALANMGRPISTAMILEVRDRTGNILYQWEPKPPQPYVIDPQVAWLITDILSDNEARLPSFGDHSPLQIGRPAAVKTGTTTDYRDNWTVGFTPQLVTGVWVGNPDNTPMYRVSGVTGAGPIWNDFMRAVLKDLPELNFERPAGMIQAEVCATSGLLPTPYCPKTRVEWFIPGTIPTEYDQLYQMYTIDTRTGLLADEDTPPIYRRDQVFLVLPQEARAWGIRNGIQPPPLPLELAAHGDGVLRLLTPDPYTIFQITPVMPFETQKVRFSVVVPPGTVRVEYWLNDHLLETVQQDPWWTWWALVPGQYTLQARATLKDGSVEQSGVVVFSVTSFVPPDQRPPSGDLN